MALARRVSLFERQVTVRLAPVAVELLHGSARILTEGEFTRRLVAVEPQSTAAMPGGEGLVVLDLAVTEELEAEGWAKDRVRELQEARRAAGLAVSDRIRLVLWVPAARLDWAQRHQDLVAREVLAVELALIDVAGADQVAVDAVDLGDGVRAVLVRV